MRNDEMDVDTLADQLVKLQLVATAYTKDDNTIIIQGYWQSTPRKAHKEYVDLNTWLNRNIDNKFDLRVLSLDERDYGKEYSYSMRLTIN